MKQDLREKYFKIRAQKENPEEASSLIIQKILKLKEFAEADSILLYFDIPGEVQLKALTEECWELGKKTYFPKIEELAIGEVKNWDELKELIKNDKVFHEPVEISDNFKLDMAVVPGVAFDREGVRLGAGAGWFDKFFSENKNIYRVGVCFKEQLADSLPREPHDILMDNVVTD